MKFKQALNESQVLLEVKLSSLAQAIKSKNPNIYKNLGMDVVDDETGKGMTFQEVSDALLEQGINIAQDKNLENNIRSSTSGEERRRQVIPQRKGYTIGQQHLQTYREKGLI